MRLRPR